MNYTLAEVLASECIQLVCRIDVLGEMRGLELGIRGLAHVVLRKLAIGAHGAAQQSAAKRSIRECRDAAVAGVRQNIALDFTLEKIVGRLNGVKWRDGSETRHLFRRIVAHPDSANFPLFVEFAKSPGGLLDRNERVRPVHLIDIDVVGSEPTQRILELLENALTRGVTFDFALSPIDADFAGNDNAVSATISEGIAHQFFGTTKAVDGRCVDQVDAQVECGMNSTDGFFLIRSAPHPTADGPGAYRDPGTNEICTVDVDVFQHICLSNFCSQHVSLSNPSQVLGAWLLENRRTFTRNPRTESELFLLAQRTNVCHQSVNLVLAERTLERGHSTF